MVGVAWGRRAGSAGTPRRYPDNLRKRGFPPPLLRNPHLWGRH
ncbi:hypothetical protein SFR_2104 [Streptomyces sp. FR-008]|nr:hypothetical protein SFR_2104 [Streptomyces sp. FR-008]